MLPSRYLIGVDSGGTAFNTMNLKHLNAFIPAALEVWHMRAQVAKRFEDIEQAINLYSSVRGVNRFPGLLEAFDLLEAACPMDPDVPEHADLRAFVQQSSLYTPSALREWMKTHPSGELEMVMAWSDRADELFERACEGLTPYEGVKEALISANHAATIAVVSSATRENVNREWLGSGLTPYVDMIMSEDDGNKTEQLIKAKAQCYGDVQMLMIADTENDCVLAHQAGARFYPIIPGDEAASWKTFQKDILPMFLIGNYTAEVEAQYLKRLQEKNA